LGEGEMAHALILGRFTGAHQHVRRLHVSPNACGTYVEGWAILVTVAAMRKLKTFAGICVAGSLLAILALPTVAQADEQQYGSDPVMQEMPRVVGRSVILDVPRLGEVSVPEEGYQKIQDLLNSDDPTDHERAFALLQRTQDEESAGGAEDAPQSIGPTSMLPPGVFAIIHPPPASASSSAAPSNAPDLAEPLSFDHSAPKHRERGLW
jgi:hypothetical protein